MLFSNRESLRFEDASSPVVPNSELEPVEEEGMFLADESETLKLYVDCNDGNIRIDKFNFVLNVEDTSGDVTVEQQPSTLGTAPLYLVVNCNKNGKWFWPKEGNNIGVAYSQFSTWASDVQTAIDWYDSDNATKGRVVSY